MGGKWTDSDMSTFLKLYQSHEVLWNPKIEAYRNSEARQSALQAIISAFEKPELTERHLKNKIKNIRTTYKREVSKILKSKRHVGSGTTGDVYNPVLTWFTQADSFLRTVTRSRGSKTNVDRPSESQMAFYDTDEYPNGAGDVSSQSSDTSSASSAKRRLDVPAMTPVTTLKVRARKKHAKAKDKLDSMAVRTTDDEFDTFARHVASQMRMIPLERALICEQEIQTLLTRERINSIRNNYSTHPSLLQSTASAIGVSPSNS